MKIMKLNVVYEIIDIIFCVNEAYVKIIEMVIIVNLKLNDANSTNFNTADNVKIDNIKIVIVNTI